MRFRSLVIRAQISKNLGNLLIDMHRLAEIKYEAELSFGNVCHTLLIVLFKMNNRNPKLGQFPDLFLHNAAERRNYQNTSIGVCTITSQSIWYSKTLDILSSFQRPLTELWWHYALRKAIPKLRLAPVSRSLFTEIERNSPVKRRTLLLKPCIRLECWSSLCGRP